MHCVVNPVQRVIGKAVGLVGVGESVLSEFALKTSAGPSCAAPKISALNDHVAATIAGAEEELMIARAPRLASDDKTAIAIVRARST